MRSEEKCLICLSKGNYPICMFCKKNPFLIEDVRKILATRKDLKYLSKMYHSSLPSIQNLNTNIFWDEKLNEVQYLSSQDGLTKDRIKAANSYIPKKIVKILDIGAGYGFLEELIEKRNSKLTMHGIDISFKGVQLLSKRFQGEFKVGTVDKIPYPDNYFDVIFALELLEHIPPHQVFKAYKEIRRVLKNAGSLIISVPLNEKLRFKKNNPSGHLREYSPSLILSELKIANFKIKKFKLLFAFSSFYKIKKMMQKIIWSKWEPNDIVVHAIKI